MNHTPKITFDGCGLNDLHDPFRRRLFTAQIQDWEELREIGPYIETACNAHEELVATLKDAITLIQSIPLTVRQVIENDTLRDLSGINPYCINEGLAMGDEPYVLPTYKLEKILTTIEKGA